MLLALVARKKLDPLGSDWVDRGRELSLCIVHHLERKETHGERSVQAADTGVEKEEHEEFVVLEGNAGADPGTVMVHSHVASAAD